MSKSEFKQFIGTWKKRRVAAELTQRHIANEINVHEFTFSRWETGKLNPTLQHIIAVEKILKKGGQAHPDFKRVILG